MSNFLSPEAIEALHRLNDGGIGRVAPCVSMVAAAELLGAGLADENNEGTIEITCEGREYLSGDCD